MMSKEKLEKVRTLASETERLTRQIAAHVVSPACSRDEAALASILLPLLAAGSAQLRAAAGIASGRAREVKRAQVQAASRHDRPA